jgi:hypothetical protein
MVGVELALNLSIFVLLFALAVIALGAFGQVLTRHLSEHELRSRYWRWDRAVLARRVIRPAWGVAAVATVATVLCALADVILDGG